MCLSTVCMHVDDTDQEVMSDVARIEAEGSGVWLTNLLGEKKFVEGTVKTVDLVDEHLVVLEPLKAGS
ncbi:MAG: CooT family nickel-binding protein [Desulfobacterales bacterium]